MGLFIFKSPTKPTRAITGKGKFLAWLLRGMGWVLHLFMGRRWQYPPEAYHDDPLRFTFTDILFFGYKYYFKTLEKAEKNSGIEDYFHEQDFSFPEKPIGATTITLSAGGDLMPYEWVSPQNTSQLWDEVGDFFFSSDIVFANLETPIYLDKHASLTPEVMLNDMLFNGDRELFDVFSGKPKYKGFDVLSTANNHMLDMGEEGIIQTLNFLKKKGIAAVGSSRTPEEQDNFPIIERDGVRVAFLAYTYSLNKFVPLTGRSYMTNYLPLNMPGTDISKIKYQALLARQRGADIVVCSLHAGCAYQAYPANHTVDLFHRVFEDAGVDIILGHHPHNPQPMEQYPYTDPITGKDKLGFAVYSLGDFVAYDLNIFCRMPLLLKFELTKTHTHAFVSGLTILPAYMAGRKAGGNMELCLVNLYRLGQNGFKHPLLDGVLQKEAKTLHTFLEQHILPPQHQIWVQG